MKDCSQFLIDQGYEPSNVGGLFFSSVFEEVVYLLYSKATDEEVKKELPSIMEEYASEFFEVEPSYFYSELLKYQKEHHSQEKEKEKKSIEDEFLQLGKDYCLLQQQNHEKKGKFTAM